MTGQRVDLALGEAHNQQTQGGDEAVRAKNERIALLRADLLAHVVRDPQRRTVQVNRATLSELLDLLGGVS